MDDVSFELVHKDPDLECPICTEVIYVSPQQVLCCRKHFCESCIRRNSTKPCPMCRHRPLKFKDASRDFINRLYSAKVWCPNKKHGCTWAGKLATVEYHLYPYQSAINTDGCIYHAVTCKYCHLELLRGNLLKHEISECPQSLLKRIERKCDSIEKRLKSIREPGDIHKQFAVIKEEVNKNCMDAVAHVEGTELKLRTEVLAQKEELRRVNKRMDQLETDQEEHKRKLSTHKSDVPSVSVAKSCNCSKLQSELSNLQSQIDLLTSSFDHGITRVSRKVDQLESKVSHIRVPQLMDQVAKVRKEMNQMSRRVENLHSSVQNTIMKQNHYINLYQTVIRLQQIGLEAAKCDTCTLDQIIAEKSFQARLRKKLEKPINRGEAIATSVIVFVVLIVIYHLFFLSDCSNESIPPLPMTQYPAVKVP